MGSTGPREVGSQPAWEEQRAVRQVTRKAYLLEGGKDGRRGAQLFVRLTWAPWTPFEVTAEIASAAKGLRCPYLQEWHLSRELLIDGGGVGDVEVTHGGEVTVLQLTYETRAWVALPGEMVREFLGAAEVVMPRGSEPLPECLSDEALADFVGSDW